MLVSPWRRLIVALSVLAFTALAIPGATAQSGEDAALRDAKRRIAQVQAELERAKATSANAHLALSEAQAQLDAIEAVVNEVAIALERQELSVADAELRLEALRAEEAADRLNLGRRAASLYKRSGLPVQAMLTSGTISEALDRTEFLRIVSLTDGAGLERVVQGQKATAAQQALLAGERERLLTLQAEQLEIRAQADALRQDRALSLAASTSQVTRLERQSDDLEKDQKRIAELIRRNQSTPAASGLPSTAGYIWPLCKNVTSEYGRRWGRLHAGIDIDGNTGDPVGASKAGVVISASGGGGYGNLVLVDHGDGVVTAYAHMSRITVSKGQSVIRGQRVGLVGSTGNSTGSHLHLEFRVNGSAVNPRRFLPSRC